VTTFTVDAEIDLRKAGLAHARGKSDKCDGIHTTEVEIESLFDPDILDAALQKLHELAHPRGTVYVSNCQESCCRDALGAIGMEWVSG
jgi:hypothetical protein